jgi:hypothetical protein
VGYQNSYMLAVQGYANLSCTDVQNANVPGPLNSPADPAYPGELGKWCAWQSAVASACSSGGCPPPPVSACADCGALSTDPNFVTAYQSGIGVYVGMDCATLDAQNVPAPPFTVGNETQMGRWCALQVAGTAATCGPSSAAGQCPALDPCTSNPALCPSGCCGPIDPAHDAPAGCATILGHDACVNAAGLGYCQWAGGPACPVPPPCAQCAAFSGDPGFQQSFQLVTQSYSSMSCVDLQAANVPGPLNPPSDPSYPGELGKWCGYQAAVAATCASGGCPAPPVPACCSPADPLDDEPVTGCAFMPGYAECVLSAGYGYCQWNAGPACLAPPSCADCDANLGTSGFLSMLQAATQQYSGIACPALAASPPPLPPVSTDPGYLSALATWCGFQGASFQTCSVGCSQTPPPDPCPSCAAASADPEFQVAFQVGIMSYSGMACAQLEAQGVPAPPFSQASATQLGRWCAIQEMGAVAACSPSSIAGVCPGQNLCAGTALCQTTCAHCDDPLVAQHPAFQSSAQMGWSSYSTQSCATLNGFLIPPPNQPIGSAPWYTQTGRWCAYELARTQNGCGSGCQVASYPTPTCADCAANAALPAYQAAYGSVYASYSANVCADLDPVGATPVGMPVTPPTVSSPSATGPWLSELGVWCAWQSALTTVCGGAEGGCP